MSVPARASTPARLLLPNAPALVAGPGRGTLLTPDGELLTLPAAELVRGVDGMAEGIPAAPDGGRLSKFRPGGLLVAHAGGDAGMFSAIVGGWVAGATGSVPVTREVRA